MRKIVLISFLVAFMLPSAALAQTSGANIGIDVIKHDPTPAEAGKFLEIWLGVTKTSGANLNDYVVEIVPEFPFFPAAGEDLIKVFPVIDSNGAVAKYELRVSEDAPNGDAVLKVRHYFEGTAAPTSGGVEVIVPILGKVDLSIASVTPDSLVPGNPTDVKFLLENTGNAPVRDLIVTWNDENDDILPLGGENRVRVANIDVGEKKEVTFKMIANPSATQGVKVVDVTMEFQRFGESDERTSQVAFIVGGLTDFDVAQDEIEDQSLSLSVANIGVNTGTGVLLSVPEQDGWKILGGSNVFLGNLESGDFTVASVDVVPESISQVRQTLKVNVDYTDTVGLRQTVEKEIVVNLSNLIEAEESSSQDPTIIVIVIVVIAAAGFWMASRKFQILGRHKKR